MNAPSRQNVEAHHHNANAAEPAVKTAKHHIISHIATMDASCPTQLWSEMIPQMQDTLNMLRTSRNNNSLTAYEEIKGSFNWNRTPMPTLGNKDVVYIIPDALNIFAPHCDEAYTVGRAAHHHQLLKFYVPAARGYRITDTYRLDPSHWALPVVSKQDKIVTTALYLLTTF